MENKEPALSIGTRKVRLVMSLGAVVAGLLVPFVTFRFATELTLTLAAMSGPGSLPVYRLGTGVSIASGLAMIAGAVVGVRFWSHFLGRVIPQLLRRQLADGPRQVDGGAPSLPQWLRASPAWWLIFVVPGYVVCAAFGASVMGLLIVVPILIVSGDTDAVERAWLMTLKPGPAAYQRGLIALILSCFTGPFVAGIYAGVAWLRAVERDGVSRSSPKAAG